jgi:uncharacterized membrane-anchored protein
MPDRCDQLVRPVHGVQGAILPRPITSLGDLLSQSRNYGGAGLGTIYTSLAFLTAIVALVAWVSFEGEPTSSAERLR